MTVQRFTLLRNTFGEDFTLGTLKLNEGFFGYTCEDKDRHLEEGKEQKIAGQTAIPRGTYKLTVTMSKRFGRLMPQIMDVPQFEGVRIHGGNSAADTEGCPLLGSIPLKSGVANCKDVVDKLIAYIQATEKIGDSCVIEIK